MSTLFHFWGNFLFESFSALCWARYNPKCFVACRFVLFSFWQEFAGFDKTSAQVNVKSVSLSLHYFAAGFLTFFQNVSENNKIDNIERNILFIGSHNSINHSIYNTNSVLIVLILCKKFFVLLVLSKSSVSQLKSFQVFIHFFGLLFRTCPAMLSSSNKNLFRFTLAHSLFNVLLEIYFLSRLASLLGELRGLLNSSCSAEHQKIKIVMLKNEFKNRNGVNSRSPFLDARFLNFVLVSLS